MSNAALLKVYDGLDPELAFLSAGNPQDLTQVLTEGAAAGNIAITALGDLTFGTGATIQGPPSATFNINGGLAQNVEVSSAVDLLLSSVGGSLTLDVPDAAGNLIVSVNANKITDITSTAAGAIVPNYVATAGAVKQLKIQIGSPGVDYYIALNPQPFT
jgi:hypothetical protein